MSHCNSNLPYIFHVKFSRELLVFSNISVFSCSFFVIILLFDINHSLPFHNRPTTVPISPCHSLLDLHSLSLLAISKKIYILQIPPPYPLPSHFLLILYILLNFLHPQFSSSILLNSSQFFINSPYDIRRIDETRRRKYYFLRLRVPSFHICIFFQIPALPITLNWIQFLWLFPRIHT